MLIRGRIAELKEELPAEAPYFVLLAGAQMTVKALHERNVRVRVLTNSLASNSQLAAHWPRTAFEDVTDYCKPVKCGDGCGEALEIARKTTPAPDPGEKILTIPFYPGGMRTSGFYETEGERTKSNSTYPQNY